MRIHSSIALAIASIALFHSTVQETRAQTCESHPTSPSASFDTTFVATATIEASSCSSTDFDLSSVAADNCHIQSEICVFRTASGGYDYVIDPSSILFGATCGMVDSMSATQLFDLIAEAAVTTAMAIGKGPCSAVPTNVQVLAPTCVVRSGSGSATQFTECSGSSTATWVATITCSSLGPLIVVNAATGTGSCSFPCEQTY
jgi:hypothetical protein